MADALLEGFKKFRKEHYEGKNALMRRLAIDGQTPSHFIISCIDSRSNPGTIFQPAPGTFLAHKAMGAIVRPYKKGTALAAALQFAIEHNKVQEIVILGHTGCGAIRALIDKIEDEEIASFIDVAQEGLKKARSLCGENCTPADLTRHAEEQIVLLSTDNLMGYPSVKKALKDDKIIIKSWVFDMDTGNLFEYDAKKGQFLAITDL